jgi:hypothetical protein
MLYWEGNYRKGGTSGPGSVGSLRQWKWENIVKYSGPITEVIDVGCGDLSFWEGKTPPSRYVGIDISQTIIDRNRERWPSSTFICSSADRTLELEQARIVFCLDVLFHIMDDGIYENILANLMRYSSEWIFVYTWRKNPFASPIFRTRVAFSSILHGKIGLGLANVGDRSSDGVYQKYRKFEDYLPLFLENGFAIKNNETSGRLEDLGSLYVFQHLKRPE